MWASFLEFSRRVIGRWFALVPGLAAGVEWSLAKATNWPSLPSNLWLGLFALGLALAMFLAFHDVRAERQEALRTIAALGNAQRLDDLHRRQDREDREQERLKDRIEDQKRNESQRRINVLRAIRQKYLLSHDGLSAGM